MNEYSIEAVMWPVDEPEAVTRHLMGVLEQVADERFAQDRQWGGPDHDDEHAPSAWRDILFDHVDRLVKFSDEPFPDFRARPIKIAALAVAAAQAWDRTMAPGESGEVLQSAD